MLFSAFTSIHNYLVMIISFYLHSIVNWKKKKKTVAFPLTPCLICWFLMLICCSISYWQPIVNLDCISFRCYRNKMLIVNCTVPRFFFIYIVLEGRGPWAPKLKFLAWTLLLCYKVEIWYDIYPDQDLRLHGRVAPGWAQGSECRTGHIEHMQNGNRIISLVPLLALES